MKECRVQNQFLFLAFLLSYFLAQIFQRYFWCSVVELDRCMICTQEWQASHVANKDMSTWRSHSYCLLQYLQEVIRTREILHHGVDYHQVKTVISNESQLVGKALPQYDMLEIFLLVYAALKLRERSRREIQAGIAFRVGRYLCKK